MTDQGCARGLCGKVNKTTALAPTGAINQCAEIGMLNRINAHKAMPSKAPIVDLSLYSFESAGVSTVNNVRAKVWI